MWCPRVQVRRVNLQDAKSWIDIKATEDLLVRRVNQGLRDFRDHQVST